MMMMRTGPHVERWSLSRLPGVLCWSFAICQDIEPEQQAVAGARAVNNEQA